MVPIEYHCETDGTAGISIFGDYLYSTEIHTYMMITCVHTTGEIFIVSITSCRKCDQNMPSCLGENFILHTKIAYMLLCMTDIGIA
jgi:hypothetical protein